METRILVVVFGLFAIGAVVVAALPRLAGQQMSSSRLWRLYGLELVIVAAILLPAYLGGAWWLAALVLLGLRAQYEFLELHAAAPLSSRSVAAQALGAAVILAAGLAGAAIAAGLAALGTIALLLAGRVRPAGANQAAAFSLLFPIAALAHLALFERLAEAFAWLAMIYIVVEVNDSFAYLCGRAFGRRRLLPRLSPSKTVLGLLAGLAAALAVGLALNAYVFALPWPAALAAVVVIVAGGLAGDFATSALKRRAGRKDFAPVLQAHGGVLDIYDSLLFAAPPFLVYHTWLIA